MFQRCFKAFTTSLSEFGWDGVDDLLIDSGMVLIQRGGYPPSYLPMNLSATQLRRAASLQEKIEAMQAELASLLGGSAPSAKPARKKHRMSAAGRKRIAEAQKARWAKQKAATTGGKKGQ